MGLIFASLVACTPTGSRQTLDEMADALQNNNPEGFLAGLDMKNYSANYLASLTANNEALSSINSITNMFGLGGLDQLINGVVDYQAILRQDLIKGVASGRLRERCSSPEQINCPWVPKSLRAAQITELGENAAIAKVTTPANLTSWIALRKINGKWLVVGQALMEGTAREYALNPAGNEPEPAAAKI